MAGTLKGNISVLQLVR